MHPSRLLVLFGYFVSFCVLGCLLAYPAYQIFDTSFERALSRSILVCAVLLFYPALKLLKLPDFSSIGFPTSSFKTHLFKAWSIGILMLLPISIFFIECGYRIWEPLAAAPYLSPFLTIISAVIAGCIIGLIEETLFRGLMQTVLAKNIGIIVTLVCVNFIYSSVHFLTIPEDTVVTTMQWYSGFSMFLAAFTPLTYVSEIWDSWLALFAAGVLLSIVRIRTNNLLWCIGIHAGWVTHIKIFKAFTDRDSDANCVWLTGSYDRYVGELSLIWIVLILLCWWVIAKRNRIKQNKTSA